jgi:signal transduction histidine kinase
LNSEQAEHLEGIKLSAKILLTIVNDVLDFSKIESGRLDIETIRFKPYDTVNELAKLLRCSVSSKPFTFDCCNELPPNLETLGDTGRIRQVLSNLLTNSFKFTPRGYVQITASLIQADDTTASVQFVIEDTGVGMDEHVLKNLFQPFRQGDVSTARLYGGTGLGLTICKQVGHFMIWMFEALTRVRSFSPSCTDKSKSNQPCQLGAKRQSSYLCRSLAKSAMAVYLPLLMSQSTPWMT